MKDNLYIVTGTSSGVGKQISLLLLKNQKSVLGIARNRLKIKNSRYKFFKHDFKFKLKIKNIKKNIKNFNFLNIICAQKKKFI